MIPWFRCFGSKQILSDPSAFIGYVKLLIHAVGSLCLVMMLNFIISAISAWISLYSIGTHAGYVGWGHIWVWCDVVLAWYAHYLVRRFGYAAFRVLLSVIWYFRTFPRPPLPSKVGLSLLAWMVSANRGFGLTSLLLGPSYMFSVFHCFSLDGTGRLVSRVGLVSSTVSSWCIMSFSCFPGLKRL